MMKQNHPKASRPANTVTVPQQSRRDFLVQAGMASAAVVSGGLAISRSAHAAGSDRMRIALIGCGGRGGGAVVNALHVDPNAQLVAMFDPFADRVLNCRKRLQAVAGKQVAVDDEHCFFGLDGHRQLLASGVDVAILAEPPHFRPTHIEACVEAGVHLLAETPMAVDAPGVRRVLAAGEKAKQKNVSFVSGFETRYSPEARAAVQQVHDGALGQIVAIQGVYNTGLLWHRGRQPQWTEMEFQLRNWYYFTWLSGDHIVEQHVHFMDKACWLLQEQPPRCAWGLGGRQVRTDPKWGDIFDHHAVVYEYASGVRVYAYCRQQPGCFNEVSDLVLGTKGRLRHGVGRGRGSAWQIEGEVNFSPPRSSESAEVNCFREMFAGIRSGRVINDSLTMARSTMLAILGRMATHSGQRITWDEAFASELVLAPKHYSWDADPPVLPGPDGRYPVPIPGVTKVL